MVHVSTASVQRLTWCGLCVSVLQNPAGTSPRGNISLADGYKQSGAQSPDRPPPDGLI